MRGKLRPRRSRVTALGIALCLLAAVFAIEAKVAWFSPAGSPSAQISASKLQTADATRESAHALGSAHPINPAHAPLPRVFAAAVATVAATPFRRPLCDVFIAKVSPDFHAPLFRRPPPQV
jgi:hypothetical protein